MLNVDRFALLVSIFDRHHPMRYAELVVLIALMRASKPIIDDDRWFLYCTISNKQIGLRTNIHFGHVSRSLKRLEAMKVIIRHSGNARRKSAFEIPIPPAAKAEPFLGLN